eukprot:IDg14024t1
MRPAVNTSCRAGSAILWFNGVVGVTRSSATGASWWPGLQLGNACAPQMQVRGPDFVRQYLQAICDRRLAFKRGPTIEGSVNDQKDREAAAPLCA